MPNWVSTDLKVTGPKEILAKFKEEAKHGDEAISFEALYPMPEELVGTSSPVSIVTQEEYDEYIQKKKAGALEGAEAIMTGGPITQEMSDRFLKEYGADNWYDWSNQAYGTKWGLCHPYLISETEDELLYHYDTAWGPADQGWLYVSSKYPELLFETFMEEESNAFNGRQDFQNGEVVFEETYSDVPSDEEIEAVCAISEMTQEEAIQQFKDYENEFEWNDRVMGAIKARMAGEEVEPLEDELAHLRL